MIIRNMNEDLVSKLKFKYSQNLINFISNII